MQTDDIFHFGQRSCTLPRARCGIVYNTAGNTTYYSSTCQAVGRSTIMSQSFSHRCIACLVVVQTMVYAARANVHTNAVFSDNMVLQTSAEAPSSSKPTTLYGTATPGEKVTLSGSQGTVSVRTTTHSSTHSSASISTQNSCWHACNRSHSMPTLSKHTHKYGARNMYTQAFLDHPIPQQPTPAASGQSRSQKTAQTACVNLKVCSARLNV